MWEQLLKARKLPSKYYILGHEIDAINLRLINPDNINLAKQVIEKLHDKLNPNSTQHNQMNGQIIFIMPSYFDEFKIIFKLYGLDEKYMHVTIRSMPPSRKWFGHNSFNIERTQNAVDEILKYLYYIGNEDDNWYLLLRDK